MVPVALRQGRTGRVGRRLHQLPADARAIRRFHRCAAGGRENGIPRIRSVNALLRRLPADRGDGRARARDAPPWPDEAFRPDRSAAAVGKTLRRRAAAPGQQARHAVQYGGLPDQAETRRAGSHPADYSRARQRRIRQTWRPAPQYFSQFAKAARCHAAAQGDAATTFRRPDHRVRRLRRIGGYRPLGRPVCRAQNGAAKRTKSRRRPPRMAPSLLTLPADTSKRRMPAIVRFNR